MLSMSAVRCNDLGVRAAPIEFRRYRSHRLIMKYTAGLTIKKSSFASGEDVGEVILHRLL